MIYPIAGRQYKVLSASGVMTTACPTVTEHCILQPTSEQLAHPDNKFKNTVGEILDMRAWTEDYNAWTAEAFFLFQYAITAMGNQDTITIPVDVLTDNDDEHTNYIGNMWACWLTGQPVMVRRVHNGFAITRF